MLNLNKVLIAGHITRDLELRFLPSNTPVCNSGIAANRTWTKDGERQKETLFIDFAAFGKQAETMNKYLGKGDPVFLEGRLHLNSWEDREGNKRSKISIVVDRFEFLKPKDNSDGPPQKESGDIQGFPRKKPDFKAIESEDNIPF